MVISVCTSNCWVLFYINESLWRLSYMALRRKCISYHWWSRRLSDRSCQHSASWERRRIKKTVSWPACLFVEIPLPQETNFILRWGPDTSALLITWNDIWCNWLKLYIYIYIYIYIFIYIWEGSGSRIAMVIWLLLKPYNDVTLVLMRLKSSIARLFAQHFFFSLTTKTTLFVRITVPFYGEFNRDLFHHNLND